MSINQRLGAIVVAMFAIAFMRMAWLIRALNPVMRRLLASPLPAGPNALLQVRGRKSGLMRTFPVAFLDVGERAYVQAASMHDEWVRNLRTAREVVIITAKRRQSFEATELDAANAGQLMNDLLARFPRSRLIRAVVGPVTRPPLPILAYFRLRVDDTLEPYVSVARQQPLFELRRSG